MAQGFQSLRILQRKRSLLFRGVSVFDFIDWLDTQATLDISFDLEQAKKFCVCVVCEICIYEIKWILQLNLQHENVSFNISFVVHLRCSVLA